MVSQESFCLPGIYQIDARSTETSQPATGYKTSTNGNKSNRRPAIVNVIHTKAKQVGNK